MNYIVLHHSGRFIWSGTSEVECAVNLGPGCYFGSGDTIQGAEQMAREYVKRYQEAAGALSRKTG